MLIAAALLELHVAEAPTIKVRRRVSRAIRDRLRSRFNVSVADVGDQDDRHAVSIGLAATGVNPVHLRGLMEKAIGSIDRLGLGEVVAQDITVLALDEVEGGEVTGAGDADWPADWPDEWNES